MIRAAGPSLVLSAVLAACSAAAQATLAPPRLDPVMSIGRMGPVSACDSPASLKALGYPVTERSKFIEDSSYPQLDIDIGQSLVVSALLDAKGERVWRLSTASPAFITPAGARVGQTLAELETRFPKHETYLSEEEGDSFTMLTGETSTYFSFAPQSIDHDCFRYWRRMTPDLKASCDAQMAKARAISFTTSCPPSPKLS